MRIIHIISVGKYGGTNIIQKYYNHVLKYMQLNISFKLIILCDKETDVSKFHHDNIIFLRFNTVSQKCFLKRLWIRAIPTLEKTLHSLSYTHLITRIDFMDKTILNFVKKYKPILEYPTPPIEKTSADRPFYLSLAKKHNPVALKNSLLNMTVIDVSYPNSYLFHNSLYNQHTPKKDYTINKTVKVLLMSSKYSKTEYNGYDRFLNGIREYLDKENSHTFEFFIAGDDKKGFESMLDFTLKKSVKINYLGFQTIAQLNSLINAIDIGINDLGFHRKGLYQANTLKTIDFLAWNLPFMISHDDVNISKHDVYHMKVPQDETSVNIKQMLSYLHDFDTVKREQMQIQCKNISLENRILNFTTFLKEKICTT